MFPAKRFNTKFPPDGMLSGCLHILSINRQTCNYFVFAKTFPNAFPPQFLAPTHTHFPQPRTHHLHIIPCTRDTILSLLYPEDTISKPKTCARLQNAPSLKRETRASHVHHVSYLMVLSEIVYIYILFPNGLSTSSIVKLTIYRLI